MQDVKIDPIALENLRTFSNPQQVVFGKTFAPAMVHCSYKDGQWGQQALIPYQKILIDPAAKVLHYAQEIFEGLKSYKNENEEVFLFRPLQNALRFNLSALTMGMPEYPSELFLSALETLVKYSAHSFEIGLNDSFYLRPFMYGDEPQLGVKPSSTYQFYLIGGPAGHYFTKGSVKIRVEENLHRASSNGTGSAKTGGNYAASMAASIQTAQEEHDQTLWLDPVHGKYIEELSGMNFFAVINNVLVTPPTGKSILHGITRDSLLKLASHLGYKTAEEHISIQTLLKQIEDGECTEAFASGTASVLTPIECMTYKNKSSFLKHSNGELSRLLKDKLQKIQTGRDEDPFGWRHQVHN